MTPKTSLFLFALLIITPFTTQKAFSTNGNEIELSYLDFSSLTNAPPRTVGVAEGKWNPHDEVWRQADFRVAQIDGLENTQAVEIADAFFALAMSNDQSRCHKAIQTIVDVTLDRSAEEYAKFNIFSKLQIFFSEIILKPLQKEHLDGIYRISLVQRYAWVLSEALKKIARKTLSPQATPRDSKKTSNGTAEERFRQTNAHVFEGILLPTSKFEYSIFALMEHDPQFAEEVLPLFLTYDFEAFYSVLAEFPTHWKEQRFKQFFEDQTNPSLKLLFPHFSHLTSLSAWEGFYRAYLEQASETARFEGTSNELHLERVKALPFVTPELQTALKMITRTRKRVPEIARRHTSAHPLLTAIHEPGENVSEKAWAFADGCQDLLTNIKTELARLEPH